MEFSRHWIDWLTEALNGSEFISLIVSWSFHSTVLVVNLKLYLQFSKLDNLKVTTSLISLWVCIFIWSLLCWMFSLKTEFWILLNWWYWYAGMIILFYMQWKESSNEWKNFCQCKQSWLCIDFLFKTFECKSHYDCTKRLFELSGTHTASKLQVQGPRVWVPDPWTCVLYPVADK